MSETITNLKVRFGADTKNFKKGMDEGARATQQFKNDAGSALDSFAAAFGVNMGEVRNGVDKMKISLSGMSQGFKTAASGSNFLTSAMKLLRVALISTGIGALVVALGSLVAYFTNTQRGADKLKQVMAGFGAIMSVLTDRLSSFGEGVYKIFTGDFKGGWDALKNSVKGIGEEIQTETVAAYNLEKQLQALQDREIALIEVQSERSKQIAAARLLAEDETVAINKRKAAVQEAAALERKSLEENKALQKERIEIMSAQLALGESSRDEIRAVEEERAKLNDIEAQSLKLQKRLQTEINSLTNEMAAQTEEIKKQAVETLKLRQAQNNGPDGKPLTAIKPLEVGIKLNTQELEIDKLADTLKTALDPAKSVITDFSDTFTNAFSGLAISFGESMGNLISGAKNTESFGNIVKASFADLAGSAGAIIIKAGVAFLMLGKAFRTAIKSPATALLAIAAGAALVAVGKATSNSLSNVADGGSGTFSSNAGGNGATFDTRSYVTGTTVKATAQPVQVEVTGQFVQRGSDLVASIAETSKRSAYNGSR